MDAALMVIAGLALVLLLLVLVLLMLNRRAARYREQQQGLHLPAGGESLTASHPPAGEGSPTPPPVEQRIAADAAPGPRVPPLNHSGDPAAALVASLVQGQGELTQPELRRLELYRPERILAACAVESKNLSGRGKEARRDRLNRIEQYAQALRSAEEPEPLAGAITESMPATSPEWGDAGEEPWRTLPADTPGEEWAGESEEGAEFGVAEVESNGWAPEAEAALAAFGLEGEAAAGGLAGSSEEPGADEFATGPGEPALAELATGAGEPVADAFPEPGARLDEVHEIWEEWPSVEEEYDRLELGQEAVEVGFGEPEAATPSEQARQPASDHLVTLDLKIHAAEDLMALPESERFDALAFLTPQELARTFSLSEDYELKRAVIDSLERIGTPQSLGSLSEILEDPDPELQIYALNAAERLLGRL